LIGSSRKDDDETYPIHTTAKDTLKEFGEDLRESGDSTYAAEEFKQLIPHLKNYCHSTVIFRRNYLDPQH